MSDEASPYFWDDTSLLEYLDEAQKEFFRRTRIKTGNEDLAVSGSVLTDGLVTAPALMFDVRRAQLASSNVPLRVYNFNEMDSVFAADIYGDELTGDWTSSTGTPRVLILDYEMGKYRLAPIPTATDTLTVWGYYLPAADIDDTGDTLEITDVRMQRSLILYMRSRAYGEHDADTYDPTKEAEYMKAFKDACKEFKYENRQKTRRLGTVAYGGI